MSGTAFQGEDSISNFLARQGSAVSSEAMSGFARRCEAGKNIYDSRSGNVG